MWNFIKQFISKPYSTGAVLPSSPDLVQEMLKPIDFERAEHIVELGPGTGVVTKALLVLASPYSFPILA